MEFKWIRHGTLPQKHLSLLSVHFASNTCSSVCVFSLYHTTFEVTVDQSYCVALSFVYFVTLNHLQQCISKHYNLLLISTAQLIVILFHHSGITAFAFTVLMLLVGILKDMSPWKYLPQDSGLCIAHGNVSYMHLCKSCRKHKSSSHSTFLLSTTAHHI